MSFGPKKVTLGDVGLKTLGAIVSGIVGSMVILIIVFMMSKFIPMEEGVSIFSKNQVGNTVFPVFFTISTFLGLLATIFLNFKFLRIIDLEKYSASRTTYAQLASFMIINFVFFSTVYFLSNDSIPVHIIFSIYVLFVIFGSHIIIELLHNYRYILVSVYAAFISLMITSICLLAFLSFTTNTLAFMVLLLLLIPISNGLFVGLMSLFQYFYALFYRYTGIDKLGDIFYKIEQDALENYQEQEQKNTI